MAGERIGGIAGHGADVRVPLFVVGTTGNAASDFRDIVNQGAPANIDLADMGPVDPLSAFAPGIGTGGTFVNGTQLNIDEACCGTGAGANVVWQGEQGGTVVSGFEDGFSYRYGPGGGDVFTSDWNLDLRQGSRSGRYSGLRRRQQRDAERIDSRVISVWVSEPLVPRPTGSTPPDRTTAPIMVTMGAATIPALGAEVPVAPG